MGPRLQLYLKAFLVTGVSFTTLVGVTILVLKPYEFSLSVLLQVGLFYGLLMSLILVTIHIRKCPESKTCEGLSVIQLRTLRFHVSMEEAFALCQAALAELKLYAVLQADPKAGILRARTRTTWSTWSHAISISLYAESPTQTWVEIESRPRLRTVLVDNGSNWRNAEVLTLWLQAHGGTALP